MEREGLMVFAVTDLLLLSSVYCLPVSTPLLIGM